LEETRNEEGREKKSGHEIDHEKVTVCFRRGLLWSSGLTKDRLWFALADPIWHLHKGFVELRVVFELEIMFGLFFCGLKRVY